MGTDPNFRASNEESKTFSKGLMTKRSSESNSMSLPEIEKEIAKLEQLNPPKEILLGGWGSEVEGTLSALKMKWKKQWQDQLKDQEADVRTLEEIFVKDKEKHGRSLRMVTANKLGRFKKVYTTLKNFLDEAKGREDHPKVSGQNHKAYKKDMKWYYKLYEDYSSGHLRREALRRNRDVQENNKRIKREKLEEE